MPQSPRRKLYYNRIRAQRKYEENKAQAIEYLGGKCTSCFSTEDLEFDHIDRTTKSFNVSRRFASSPISNLMEELNKCQLLCKECHKDKTRRE